MSCDVNQVLYGECGHKTLCLLFTIQIKIEQRFLLTISYVYVSAHTVMYNNTVTTCFFFFAENVLSCFNHSEENKIYQKYYQWVPLIFIIQAAISYVPAYLWKVADGGLLHKLCDNLGRSLSV